MISKPRFPLFGGLRALAAGLVFVYHAWFLYHRPDCGLVECRPDNSVVGSWWSGAVVNFGAQGVALFYVISGFLLYRQFVVLRKTEQMSWTSVKRYSARRLARILPAYWAVMLIVGLTATDSPMSSPAGFIQYMGLVQIYDQSALWRNPVPATWTVCVELSFYGFLPIWAYLMQQCVLLFRRSWRFELVALAGLAGASVAWKFAVVDSLSVANDFQPLLVALPASLDLFAAGMCLAVLSVHFGGSEQLGRMIARIPAAGLAWMAAVVVYAVMCWLVAFDGPLGENWKARSLILAVLKLPVAVGLILPAVVGGGSGAVARSLGSRAALWIGVVSYGLYLWHVPVLRAVGGADAILFHSGYLTVAIGSIVAFLLSLAIAAVSWQMLERPVIDGVRGLLGRDRDGSENSVRQGVVIEA